jgi:pimeloyl-ACP methyl ester carboxylesterase
VDACTEAPLDRASFAELVGANMLCPALVRRALFAADVDLRPVFRDMECEALVIHGAADRVVTPETGVSAARLMRTGGLISYDGIGHAPFLEAPDRFARDVGDFATSVHEKIARRWRQVSSNSSQPEGR